MQESRLFKIMYYLLDKGKTTAPELAEKFEVSVRTIYRDMDMLSSAGIPIFATQGKSGGIALMKNYVFDKAVVSKEEQQQIIMALQNLSAASPDAGRLLHKMGALFREDTSDWIQVDFSRWGNTDFDQEKFNLIKAAILDKQLLTFYYLNSSNGSSDRQVKPAKLLYKSKAWYLQAYCMEKKDYRVFKINRMDNLRLSSETFTDTLMPPPAEPEKSNVEFPQLQLKFKSEAAYRVYDEFNRTDIQPLADGDLMVSCCFPETPWLYSYLLSFCGSVDVLQPLHIRESLKDLTEKMYLHYSKL